MLKKLTLLLACLLAGCANHTDETIATLNKIALPALTTSAADLTAPAELQSLHADNHALIVSLTSAIKQQKTNDARTADVLDPNSEVHAAFKALTRLEEMNQLNELYLKEHNGTGLAAIGRALQPLKGKAA